VNKSAIFLFLAIAALPANVVLAQAYPSKPIRVIDGFPAGGSTDIVARIIAAKFQESQGQPWIVDNRAGAQGIIGGELAAKAPPDGYTLLMFTTTFTLHPAIYKNLPFDITKAFVGVIQTSTITNVLAVHPSVPARTVQELIALAKTKPGRLNFAAGGTGPQMAGELFNSMAGVKITHIPYKGGAPAVAAAVGGEADLTFATMPTAISHIRSGRLRALGACTATRTMLLPDLPTIAEAGVPGYDAPNSVGVLAPAGTPREIVVKLQQEIARILAIREVQDRLLTAGIEPSSMKPEQFTEHIRAEVAKWTKVVKAAGLEPQSY
jgi:tripartite-type tricarboxylate transporter receptor subunit TctC